MIIIVSHEKDKHASVILEKLKEKGEDVVLLDYAEYPTFWQGNVLFQEKQMNVTLTIDGQRIPGKSVKSIFYRRPRAAGMNLKYKNQAFTKYIREESEAFLASLPHLIKAFWVSDPEAIERASFKPLQLCVAKSMGFKIPASSIGNSPKDVSMFLESLNETSIVTKSLESSYVEIDPATLSHNFVVYTKQVQSNWVRKHIGQIKNCPIIVQECINKKFDVRVTVVGNQVFAVAIETKGKKDVVDWRYYSLQRKYKPHSLPPIIIKKCRELVRRLGLTFGCIDLGYTSKGEYIFFEINPAGQWLASEIYAGEQISDAITDLLSRGKI